MTDKLSGYSTTPGDNNDAVPDGWPEGMLPSDVNNCAREMMARVREWYEDAVWIDLGHTIVSATASTIVVSGDQTAFYTAGRALRADGTDYGYISSSTYGAPNTTINVTGFSVSGTPTTVEVSLVTAGRELPQNLTVSALTATGTVTISGGLSVTGQAAFSGTLTVGTNTSGVTQTAGDNSTKLATTSFVFAAQAVRQHIVTRTTTGTSTSSYIYPADGSKPQYSEGYNFLSQAFTPVSGSSMIHVRVTAYLGASDGYPTMGLFRDTAADAVSVGMGAATSADSPVPVTAEYYDASMSGSARTYSAHVAGRSVGAISVNRGITTAYPFGTNTIQSFMEITEYV